MPSVVVVVVVVFKGDDLLYQLDFLENHGSRMLIWTLLWRWDILLKM